MSKKYWNFIIDFVTIFFVTMFIIGCLLFIFSCSPQYVTVPEYHYESHVLRDTVLRTDTFTNNRETVIREADSTMLDELGIRLKQGERAILVLRKELERMSSRQKETVHDTVIKTDSIRVPYPVEKQLSRWESLKMQAGGYVFVLLIIAVLWLIISTLRSQGIIFRRARDSPKD